MRSGHLATGTLACPLCDAPVALAGAFAGPADRARLPLLRPHGRGARLPLARGAIAARPRRRAGPHAGDADRRAEGGRLDGGVAHGQAAQVVVALAMRHAAGAQRRDEVGERRPRARRKRSGSRSGRSSPSQVAIPPSPIARHQPVHDVSSRGAAQLPTNVKRRSPVIAKTAVAAAGPSYQLHGGLYGVAVDRQRVGAGERARGVEQVDGHVEQQRLREREQELGPRRRGGCGGTRR